MEWTRLALDYIDTLIWPLAVVGLVAFFLVRFRHNIARVIDRIQGAKGPGGFEISAPAGPSDQSPIDPSSGGAAADALSGAMQDLAGRYTDVVTNLSQTSANAKELEKAYQTVSVLYQFEKIYRVIYGTQLTFMLALLGAPNHTLPEVSLTPTYDLHVKRTAGEPNYTPTTEAFAAFLISSEMITFDDQARTYQLTDWGSGLINYINQQGLSYTKGY